MKTCIVLSLILMAMTQAQGQERAWDTLVDRFFDQADFRFNPSAGTAAGFHQYDPKLEDFSRTSIQQQIGVLRQYEQEVLDFPGSKLTPEQATDRDLVLNTIRSEQIRN